MSSSVKQTGPLFELGSVVITPKIARFGDTSYPIANIGSVRIKVEDKNSNLPVFVFLMSFLGFFIHWIVVLMGVAFSISLASKLTKKEANLILKTSSGDVQAFQSTNVDLVQRIKAAIEDAFTGEPNQAV